MKDLQIFSLPFYRLSFHNLSHLFMEKCPRICKYVLKSPQHERVWGKKNSCCVLIALPRDHLCHLGLLCSFPEIFFEALGCNVSIEIVQSLYSCKVNCEVDAGFSGTGFSEPHNSDL